MKGLGLRILGLRVYIGYMNWVYGIGDRKFGFRVQVLGFEIEGLGFQS